MHVQTNVAEKKRDKLLKNKGKHENNLTKAVTEKKGKIRQKDLETFQRKLPNAKLLKRKKGINTKQGGDKRLEKKSKTLKNARNMAEKKLHKTGAKNGRKQQKDYGENWFETKIIA